MLTLFALLLVITTTYSDGAGAALACDKTAAEIKAITDATVATLRNKNLRVVEGEMKVFETKAFGANVGNPYVVYFHPAPSPIPSPSASLPAFRLGKKTAVLFVGCTPASAAYFSFRSYALNRGKDLVFASLGDSLNNLVINTTSTSTSTGRKGAGSAAGSTAAVVTTADAGTYQLVKDALEISGLPLTATNLDAIPSSLLDMGTTAFTMLHRASVWSDKQQRAAYFNQSRRIFFIEPPAVIPASPLPVAALRPEGTGHSEMEIAGLAKGLAAVTAGVTSSMQSNGCKLVAARPLLPYHDDHHGLDCLRLGTDCEGDNYDTHYLTANFSNLAVADRYVVVGSNSAQTEKTTYTNLDLYKVVAGIGHSHRPVATNDTATDRDFLGNCRRNKYCMQLSTAQLPTANAWALIYRTYLEPATKTAPKLSEIYSPTVLQFTCNAGREGGEIDSLD
eukprot:gene1932-17314_t